MRLSIVAAALILGCAAPATAQTPPAPPPASTARPADAATSEAIVMARLRDSGTGPPSHQHLIALSQLRKE